MVTATVILGLYTETSVHVGAGQAMDVVDLPIQREAHSEWPVIYGSSLKGALRDHLSAVVDRETVMAAFGPEMKAATEYAGAVAVTDARILLLPVRSLTGIYHWVTAPEVLGRLRRDAEWLGWNLDLPQDPVPEPSPSGDAGADVGWVVPEAASSDPLILETCRVHGTPNPDLDSWVAVLAALMPRPDAVACLKRRLVVVGDDLFTYLSKRSTPVNAHVRLDPGTKTVVSGALWYEETLAPDSLLYTAVLAGTDRRPKPDRRMTPEALRQAVVGPFDRDPYLRVGGNETVGMGWCRVQLVYPDRRES